MGFECIAKGVRHVDSRVLLDSLGSMASIIMNVCKEFSVEAEIVVIFH
jgi:hypothetical protein